MLPWKYLQTNEIETVFGELYHLFSVKFKEYSQLPEEKRTPHRTQYR